MTPSRPPDPPTAADLWRKLNLGTHETIAVLDAPPSFEPALASLTGVRILRKMSARTPVPWAIAFAITQAALDRASAALALGAPGDAVVWVAYPKGSSTRHRCEFNRDSGWAALGAAGFEAVRQVAIDADWTALRFRRVEFIKTLSRHPDGAITRQGKQRTRAR